MINIIILSSLITMVFSQWPDPYCDNGIKDGIACYPSGCSQFLVDDCQGECCYISETTPYCDDVVSGITCKIRGPDPFCQYGKRSGIACFPKGCSQFGGTGCQTPCCYFEYKGEESLRPYCDVAGPGCRIKPTIPPTNSPTTPVDTCKPTELTRWFHAQTLDTYVRPGTSHAGRGWRYNKVLGYICSLPDAGTRPLYDYYKGKPFHDHWTDIVSVAGTGPTRHGYQKRTLIGYIYTTQVAGTKPAYNRWCNARLDRLFTDNQGEYARNGYTGAALVGYILTVPSTAAKSANFIDFINNNEWLDVEENNKNYNNELMEIVFVNLLISMITCVVVVAVCVLIYYGCYGKSGYHVVAKKDEENSN